MTNTTPKMFALTVKTSPRARKTTVQFAYGETAEQCREVTQRVMSEYGSHVIVAVRELSEADALHVEEHGTCC